MLVPRGQTRPCRTGILQLAAVIARSTTIGLCRQPRALTRAIHEGWSVGIAQVQEKPLDMYAALLGNFVRLCLLLDEWIPNAAIKELLEQVALDVSCRRRANPGNVSGLHPHPADHIRRLVRINV